MSLNKMVQGVNYDTTTLRENVNGLVSGSTQSEINSDFSNKPDGAITTTDTGDTLSLTTNAGANAELRILDGRVTNTATGDESAAGHMMVLGLPNNIRRIGAEFEMNSEGATTSGGALALVLWSEHLIYPGPVVDTEMHITFSNLTWNIGRFIDGSYTSYATGSYLKELESDKLYKVEVVITESNRIFVLLPDGQVVETPNDRISQVAHAIPSWEVFEGNASTDWKTKIKTIWAEQKVNKTFGGLPKTSDMYERTIDTLTSLLSSAKDYPLAEAGNVGVNIPQSSAYISDQLDVEFIAPPSGEVLVEFSAQVKIFATGPLIWTLLINEASFSESRNLTSEEGSWVHNAKFLVDGLQSGQKYTAKWQHRMFSGTATLRANRASGEVVTAIVTPVQ